MNINRFKKLLFLFLLGIGVFFINNGRVEAANYICQYDDPDGKWGTLYFFVPDDYNDGDVFYRYSYADKYYIETVENSYSTRQLNKSLWKIYDSSTKEYSCPRLYYETEEVDFKDESGQVYSYQYKITFSKDKISNKYVDSSIGKTVLNPVDSYCDAKLDELKKIFNSYPTSYINENINKIKDLASKDYKDLDYSDSEYAERYSKNVSYYIDPYAKQIETIEKNSLSEMQSNRCTDALKLYHTIVDKINNDLQLTQQYLNELYEKMEKAHQEELLTSERYDEQIKKIEEALENLNRLDSEFNTKGNGATTCEGLLGPNVMNDIEEILGWVRIIVPILIIVLGIVDFSKAVLASDDKVLSKAVSNLIKRAVIAVAVFFAPIIIMYLLKLADEYMEVKQGCNLTNLFIYFSYFK